MSKEASARLEEYAASKQSLEVELAGLRAELKATERRGQDARQLALELEKERGWLAGQWLGHRYVYIKNNVVHIGKELQCNIVQHENLLLFSCGY